MECYDKVLGKMDLEKYSKVNINRIKDLLSMGINLIDYIEYNRPEIIDEEIKHRSETFKSIHKNMFRNILKEEKLLGGGK